MVEERVNRYIDSVLHSEALEQVFQGFIIVDSRSAQLKVKRFQEDIQTLFAAIPQENHDQALKVYIDIAATCCGLNQSARLLSLLEYAVANNFIAAKNVCESILRCEKLKYTNRQFWCESFKLIRQIISLVDYKGIRDLLKAILEICRSIPSNINISILEQVTAISNVFEHIFDRDAALLPSYLILDELQKHRPFHRNGLHWKFSKLLNNFIDSFKPIAQMVSIVGRPKLLPIIGSSIPMSSLLKLEPMTAKFTLKGLLPYSKELTESQDGLLRYVLEQPYSRDMFREMLGLNKQAKQRCVVLENQLVDLLVAAMEKLETEDLSTMSETQVQQELLLWHHLSNQLIYFVLFQFANFNAICLDLHAKLMAKNLNKGRDHLMWLLLQFISGSIHKNPVVQLSDFLSVLPLLDLLYPEKEPLPIPDVSEFISTYAFAATSIWMHLNKKAITERNRIQRPLPTALKTQYEYLQQAINSQFTWTNDFRVSIVCNAYSTNTELFSRPMAALVEAIQGPQQMSSSSLSTPSNGSNVSTTGPTVPLSLSVLDSLTVHTKMSLIHSIGTQIIKMSQPRSSIPISPALMETYSRLLVYNEIESLGVKGFINQLLPTVFRHQAWSMLHTLLELFSHRLHHVAAHYRVQLLTHLYSIAAAPQTTHIQLHLCVESTALKLISGLNNTDVQPQLSRFQQEPKNLMSQDSEELNKVLVLTLARAIHITGSEHLTGSWCKEYLSTMMAATPHTWSSYTLACFPSVLADFYHHNPVQKENKPQLKRSVEEEYRKWKTMSNENDIISHFSQQGSSPLFLCLLWKMLLENDRINPLAYKILDRIGARALSTHLRTFADFLVFEFANSVGGQHVNKCIDALNDMICKCHIITLDRLILYLALRNFDGSEAQVCFFIIHLLLVRPNEFKNKVTDFVMENSPEYWMQNNWHEKHGNFLRRYPEKFYFEGLQDLSASSSQHTYYPVYFTNVCLRFLTVMDIVIHRFLELSACSSMSVESLLEKLGCLYKFHDHPISYLYNTLHYYEKKLRDRPDLKRRLVLSIIGAFDDVKPAGWALTETYLQKQKKTEESKINLADWEPDLDYYTKLVGRLVDTIAGKPSFPHMDWRFNEFPNQAAHALHVTCIELMALPRPPSVVGNALLDVVLIGHVYVERINIQAWINALGLIMSSLPEAYWSVVYDRIVDVVGDLGENLCCPLQMFDFSSSHSGLVENHCSYLIAAVHAVWFHASIGQISTLSQFLTERLKPVVKREEQFLFVCHLVAPFIQRFHIERTRTMKDVSIAMYEMLETVDKNCEELHYIDTICDLFYHIKYMFIGDLVKSEAERYIRNYRPELQLKLRFNANLNPTMQEEMGGTPIP